MICVVFKYHMICVAFKYHIKKTVITELKSLLPSSNFLAENLKQIFSKRYLPKLIFKVDHSLETILITGENTFPDI